MGGELFFMKCVEGLLPGKYREKARRIVRAAI